MTLFFSITTIIFLTGTSYFARRAFVLAGLLADEQEYMEQLEVTNAYMYSKITEAYNSMKQIDRLGAFEEDDEAGTTFALLKQTIEELKETFEDGQEEEK
jgi:hypothetical protein